MLSTTSSRATPDRYNPSVRAGRDFERRFAGRHLRGSIRARPVGRDDLSSYALVSRKVSIHSPSRRSMSFRSTRSERDNMAGSTWFKLTWLQSTRPHELTKGFWFRPFNPRAPRRARRPGLQNTFKDKMFQTHAPGPCTRSTLRSRGKMFRSTRP